MEGTPIEIFLIIFSSLELKDYLHTSCVSSQWKELSDTPLLVLYSFESDDDFPFPSGENWLLNDGEIMSWKFRPNGKKVPTQKPNFWFYFDKMDWFASSFLAEKNHRMENAFQTKLPYLRNSKIPTLEANASFLWFTHLLTFPFKGREYLQKSIHNNAWKHSRQNHTAVKIGLCQG